MTSGKLRQRSFLMKARLDQILVRNGLVPTRSQAEGYIKLGYVKVDDQQITKAGFQVDENAKIELNIEQQYVSRAALKLASVSEKLKLDFSGKVVLDAGSSTGGFTQYALLHSAAKVIAVDVGTNQLHPALREDPRIELHENTDIRDFKTNQKIDLALIDVSFISMREVLPAVAGLIGKHGQIAAMVKPQFEGGNKDKHKGVVKNNKMRRGILKDFEAWTKSDFVIIDKADSEVAGAKGNLERFYLLKKRAQ
jgi:23S rRNA (cytidine1920-2'-O)/16S rRNA (cytidine1409-2'-O)-methyltransferase